ncbi:hypothetical protein FRC01_008539, partial [Tulasnella sp. 417]
MSVTLTSRKDHDEILLRLKDALKKPTALLPIYILIWYLHTTVVLLLSALLLWVRLVWKCGTTALEILAFPFVMTVRVQVYAIFWTLGNCGDALIRCWECMDRLSAALERSFGNISVSKMTSSGFRVPLPVELTALVLGHLRGDKRSLLSCTYVNHLFHDEANRILWEHLSLHHGPNIQKAYYGLVIFIEPNVPVIDRRSLIKTIKISEDCRSKDGPSSPDDCNRLLHNLPSLKELVIEKKTSFSMKFRPEYLSTGRPNLETIVVRDYSPDLDIGFWAFVQVHDNLKTLRYSVGKATQQQLEEFMEPDAEKGHACLKPGTMPKLETITAPASVVGQLVLGRPVKFVKIEGALSPGPGERIVDALCRSTVGVRHLDLELSHLNVERLVSRLSLLEELEELVVRWSQSPRRNAVV